MYNKFMPVGDLNSLVSHLTETGILKTPLIIDAFLNIDRMKFVPDAAKQWAYIDQPLSIAGGQTISQPYTVAFMLELLEPQPGEKILDIGAGSGWQTGLLAHIVSSGEGGGLPAGNAGLPAGRQGKVFAVEIVPELCKLGKKNVSQFNFVEKGVVRFLCGDASKKETFEPAGDEISEGVDKIIAAAALDAPARNASPASNAESASPETLSRMRCGRVASAGWHSDAGGQIPPAWKDMLKIGGKIVVPIGN